MSSKPSTKPAGETPEKAAPRPLQEDDEFEDFPVEDWNEAETDQNDEKIKQLWEESWDDDDTTDDFSAQLREELKKNPGRNESMS